MGLACLKGVSLTFGVTSGRILGLAGDIFQDIPLPLLKKVCQGSKPSKILDPSGWIVVVVKFHLESVGLPNHDSGWSNPLCFTT